MQALITKVKETPSVQIAQGIIATKLETDGDRVTGLWVESSTEPSEAILISGSAYLWRAGDLADYMLQPPTRRVFVGKSSGWQQEPER